MQNIVIPASDNQWGTHTVANNIDHFSDIVSDIFCPMSCVTNAKTTDEKAIDAEVNYGQLNSVGLSTISSLPLRVKRDRQHISLATDNYYLVKFQLSGFARVRHMQQDVNLQPGDFTICSSSEPYDLEFYESYKQAVLSIPQPQLNDLAPDVSRYLGQRMAGESPTNGILTQFVSSLVARYKALPATTLKRMEVNVLDLLITSIESQQSEALIQEKSVTVNHLNRVKQFIAFHLQDYRLSPGFIAEAEGISTRYLHMLFQSEQVSVSRYIQLKRLEVCALMLSDMKYAHLSTMDIALQVGFNDVSHFHRCFKSFYGLTPRHYRLQNS